MTKRIRARVVVQQPVEYRHAGGQGQGVLMNLALQGCQIKGVSGFSCGTRLRLQLWLADQFQPLDIEQAVVRWVKSDQLGVSFLKMSPDARMRLEQMFQRLYEAQYPAAPVSPGTALERYSELRRAEGYAPDWNGVI
jgi:hypothetical protein